MVKNTNLYASLKGYTKEAVRFLRDQVRQIESIPETTRERCEIIDNGYSLSSVTVKDWFRFVLRKEASLTSLDAYQEAKQSMEKDEVVAKHLDTLVGAEGHSRGRVGSDRILQSALIQMLETQQGLRFRQKSFDQIYENLEKFFYCDTFEFRFFAPLHGFQMDAERIKLGPRLALIRIPKAEREAMIVQSRMFGFPRFDFQVSEFALELYLEAPKVIGEVPPTANEPNLGEIARKEFDEVCSALRLYKKGAIGFRYIDMRQISPSSYAFGGLMSIGPIGQEPPLSLPGVFSRKDTQSFLKFWQRYRKAREIERATIEIALRRLNFSYERERDEDKLIDYMIGLEALLVLERLELSYRLALRGAALLGGNAPDARQRIFKELRAAYDTRGAIVHGESPPMSINVGSEAISFIELVDRVEEHLRSTIKEFLWQCEKGFSEKQVQQSIDEQIMRGFR